MDVEALQKMTVAELREEAKKLDVKGIATMKKDALVHLLASSSGPGHTTKKGKLGSLDLHALKHRVRELKAKRTAATAKGQKAKVTEFNEDLHQLRRRLRRAARRRRRSA